MKEKKIHKRVIEVIQYAHDSHFSLVGLTYSPITGGIGNIEFLGCFKLGQYDENYDIESVVEKAHLHFEG